MAETVLKVEVVSVVGLEIVVVAISVAEVYAAVVVAEFAIAAINEEISLKDMIIGIDISKMPK